MQGSVSCGSYSSCKLFMELAIISSHGVESIMLRDIRDSMKSSQSHLYRLSRMNCRSATELIFLSLEGRPVYTCNSSNVCGIGVIKYVKFLTSMVSGNGPPKGSKRLGVSAIRSLAFQRNSASDCIKVSLTFENVGLPVDSWARFPYNVASRRSEVNWDTDFWLIGWNGYAFMLMELRSLRKKR